MSEQEQVTQEQATQVAEEAQQKTSAGAQVSSTPDVKQEAEEPKNSNLVDEDGVPWKNRAKEYERKYTQTLEKFASYERKAPEPAVDENDEIPATRAGVKQVMQELTREEIAADNVINDVISEMELMNPEIANLKDKITQQLKTVDVRQRKDPGLVKAVAYAVFGESAFSRKQEPAKPAAKKLVIGAKTDVLPPNPQGGNISEVRLTEDEEAYAFAHRMKERGFNNEEIHDFYKKSMKRGG